MFLWSSRYNPTSSFKIEPLYILQLTRPPYWSPGQRQVHVVFENDKTSENLGWGIWLGSHIIFFNIMSPAN